MAEFSTYVRHHPETGEQQERTPRTPAEEVALRFDGWRKKPSRAAKSTAAKSSGGSKSTSNS